MLTETCPTDLAHDPHLEDDLHVARQLPPGHPPRQHLPAQHRKRIDIHLIAGEAEESCQTKQTALCGRLSSGQPRLPVRQTRTEHSIRCLASAGTQSGDARQLLMTVPSHSRACRQRLHSNRGRSQEPAGAAETHSRTTNSCPSLRDAPLLHSARCQSPATPSSKLTLWSHVSRSAGLASRAGHKGVVLELGDAKVAHLGAPSRVQQNILHKHRWWASHVVWVSADGCRAGPTHDAYRLQHYHPGLHHKCMACL